MSKRQTFIDLCLKGKVLPDEIDDFIDRWHGTPKHIELHDYLGMRREEYSLWLRVPDALSYIIEARLKKQPLPDVIDHRCWDLQRSNRPEDQSIISRLQKWLRENVKLDEQSRENSVR